MNTEGTVKTINHQVTRVTPQRCVLSGSAVKFFLTRIAHLSSPEYSPQSTRKASNAKFLISR